jgi:hypothetical protein
MFPCWHTLSSFLPHLSLWKPHGHCCKIKISDEVLSRGSLGNTSSQTARITSTLHGNIISHQDWWVCEVKESNHTQDVYRVPWSLVPTHTTKTRYKGRCSENETQHNEQPTKKSVIAIKKKVPNSLLPIAERVKLTTIPLTLSEFPLVIKRPLNRYPKKIWSFKGVISFLMSLQRLLEPYALS